MTEGGLTALDWAVIAVYLALTLGAGILVSRRSRGSVENFFLSGRSLPWWLAGTSMVATSFASDTPLVVSGWTRAGGVAGNWRWWCYMLGTLLVVVLFARLWRRSEVVTDVEFMELRYSGRPARALRAFKSVYQCVFLHCFVMGWVILGMTKVLMVLLDLGEEPLWQVQGVGITPAWAAMLGCALLALIYSDLSGLWGVVVTDVIQFVFAMGGAVVLMLAVIDGFGGLEPLVDALQASPLTAGKLGATPATGGALLLDPVTWTAELWQFLVFVGVVWIANKNSDGSGVMVQRILASKDERHALLGTVWYAVAHFAIRPWPWILVALASLLVLPPFRADSPVSGRVLSLEGAAVQIVDAEGRVHAVPRPETGIAGWHAEPLVQVGDAVAAGQPVAATDDEKAYPLMMRRYLTPGWIGLLVASFLAAFMSTVDSHLNTATSYLVNDLYRRFLRPAAAPGHYVVMARVLGPVVLAISLAFAATAGSVRQMFDEFTALFSGVGVVYVLRWIWWRVNAWSEIAALLTSAAATVALGRWPGLGAALLPAPLVQDGRPDIAGVLLLVVGASLAVTLPVTLLTAPVDRERLVAFYERVRPPGFWGPVRGPRPGARSWVLSRLSLAWAGATLLLGAAILLPGNLLLEDGSHAVGLLGAGLLGALLLAAWPRDGARHAAREP